MKLQLVRHLWGVDGSEGFDAHEAHWREMGYEMLEGNIRHSPHAEAVTNLLEKREWPFIAQVFSRDFEPGGTVGDHLSTLKQQMQDLLRYEPVFFNAHTGADSWSMDQTIDFYGQVLEIEKELGIPIAHETHRLRPFGNPWVTRDVLKQFPDLKLTVDLSHWVCVCERLLTDLGDIIALVAKRCYHLHARVGYEQGPQVPDPRAPEWRHHLEIHEVWWDIIWQSQRKAGIEHSTLTPEFGPYPYLQTLPFRNEPVADLEAICDWMAQRQAKRFTGS